MYISEDEMYFQCDAYIYYYLFIERVDVFKLLESIVIVLIDPYIVIQCL